MKKEKIDLNKLRKLFILRNYNKPLDVNLIFENINNKDKNNKLIKSKKTKKYLCFIKNKIK